MHTNAQSFLVNKRSLASCSSYSSCSTCLSDSSCTLLDNTCSSTSSSTVSSDAYSSSESTYCSNYSSSGILYLGGSGSDSFSLYQLSGTSISSHPTCYWKIENSSSKQVSVKIQRSTLSYEDIAIEYNYNSKSYTLTTRDVANCVSDTVTLNLNTVASVYIKVKRLNANSNYSITVTSTNSGSSQILWELIVGIVVSIFVFTVIAIIIFIVVLIIWRRRRSNQYREVPQDKEKIRKNTKATMNNMCSGEFQNCNQRFKQDSCVICLEQFANHNKVHITNECLHIFHTNCLRIWYLNSLKEKLSCPHCKTENSPHSKPKEDNIFIAPSSAPEGIQSHVAGSEISLHEENAN